MHKKTSVDPDYEKEIEFVVKNGLPNYYSRLFSKVDDSTHHMSEIIHSFHFDSDANQTYYETNTLEQLVDTPQRIYDWAGLKRFSWYNENGTYRGKKDGYGVITKYNYDTYGNLDSVRIYNEKNSSNYLETKYMYNGIEDRLREVPITIKQSGIEQTFTYNDPFMTLDSVNIGDYKQKLKYDNFEEKIVSIENIGANNNPKLNNYDIMKTEIEFDDYGRIKSCKDSNNNAYGIVYNVFSEPAKYYYNGRLKASTVLRRYNSEDIYKETKYNTRQNVTTTNLDKYGRITSQNNGDYQIQYTYSDKDKLEGPHASYIKKVIDPYEGKEYTYNYDNETQKGTLSNGKLTIVNDSNADIKYDFTENSYYIVNTITDETSIRENNEALYPKLVEPRLKRTKYTKCDKNNDNKVIDEYKEFNFTYRFDDLGRFVGKTGEVCENKINVDKDITYTNGTSNIEKIDYTIHSGKEHVCFSYQNPKYDNKGNIIKVIEEGKRYKENPTKDGKRAIVDLLNREYTYTYDGLNRLVNEERNTSGNISINEYVYDNTNMLSAVKKDGVEIKTFENEAGKLKKVEIGGNTYQIEYDLYGNTTKVISTNENSHNKKITIEYNERNQVSKILYNNDMLEQEKKDALIQQTNDYNYQGKRYRKRINFYKNEKINYRDIHYYFDGDRIIGEDWLDENGTLEEEIRYFYDAEGISGMSYKGHNFNLIKDSLGNISKIMYQGKMIGEYVYDAWGNCEVIELSIDGEKDAGQRDSFVLYNNPFRYKGYYCDIETHLYWVSSRYYNPEWGRWISPDSIEYLDPESINGLNLYAYCGNNPVSYKQRPVSSGGSVISSSVSSISNGGIYSSGNVSSGSVGSSRVNWENGGFQIPIWISSLMSGSDFGASIAPALRTIYQYIRYPGVKDLNKLYSLDFVPGKLNTVCSVIGYGLLGINIGLSAWSNFTNDNLTTKQQWISFGGDTAYTLGTFGIGYGVGALVSLIPGVGVFIAPFVSAGVTWLIDWTNEKWGWLDDVKQWFNDL